MRSLRLEITLMCLFIINGCKDPIQVTDVTGDQSNFIEYPCLASIDDCLNIMDIGGGNFNFYSSFHIDSLSEVKGAIITIHGHSRNADDYFNKMISIVSGQGLKNEIMVISPKFITLYEQSTDSDWYWNTTSWKWGLQSYSSSTGNNVSTFEVIDSLLSRLSNKDLFPQLTDIIVTGHSSGAAFVHMYSSTKQNNMYNNLNLHFSVVNNQYFLHTDSTRLLPNGSLSVIENCNVYNNWPYGLDVLSPYMDMVGKENSKNNFLSNKVDYFIAELDTETGDITSGCQYEFLGNNRYEKNMNYMQYMNVVYPDNQHGLTTIPGLGHTTNTYSSATFIEYINAIF